MEISRIKPGNDLSFPSGLHCCLGKSLSLLLAEKCWVSVSHRGVAAGRERKGDVVTKGLDDMTENCDHFQGCPAFWHLWATLEEEELFWATQ